MGFSIYVGWWALPLLVTVVSFGYAFSIPGEPSRGMYSFPDPMPVVRAVCALVVSLVSWLIYFIVV